jgi:hypothetical protein
MMRLFPIGVAALVWVAGCKSDPPEKLLDTGWFTDTSADTGDDGRCANRIELSVPEGGESDWYWREMPRIFTSNRNQPAYDAFVTDADGVRLPSTLVWAPDSLRFTVQHDAAFEANTEHTLHLVDCEGTRTVPFTTSGFGAPIDGGPSALQGTTYSLDLGAADWIEPGGVAPLLTLFFDAPALIGVPLANPSQLHLSFAIGEEDDDGAITQDPGEAPIPFPVVDFSQQPYFAAQAPVVNLEVSAVVIPVYDFAFSGTFSADGTRIGGGTVQGIGDTRFAGPLLGSNEPGAVCSTAQGLGVQCGPCPNDGQVYCLPVSVERIEGVKVPGLVLGSP